MSGPPLIYQWTGDSMVPVKGFGKLADKHFVVGENYRLEVVEQRSMDSHRHFFATLTMAWQNIPEIHANRWRTPDHLRRWALIQAGYKTETTFVCASKAEALRFAPFLQSLDDYAEVIVSGKLVCIARAKSQSLKEMPGKEFQASKQAVLDVIAKLIGVDSATLAAQSPRVASPSVAPQRQTRERERA